MTREQEQASKAYQILGMIKRTLNYVIAGKK